MWTAGILLISPLLYACSPADSPAEAETPRRARNRVERQPSLMGMPNLLEECESYEDGATLDECNSGINPPPGVSGLTAGCMAHLGYVLHASHQKVGSPAHVSADVPGGLLQGRR